MPESSPGAAHRWSRDAATSRHGEPPVPTAGPGAFTTRRPRREAGRTGPEEVRADAALTEIMPALGQGRFTHWRGTLPLSAAVQRRPGRSKLPGRPAQATAPDERPSTALLDRVLAGLRTL
ncbi:hypothetical protein SAMN04487905_1024 [Actinopolyspora xinjiangensis]|uniref:Uncharacterized protein n=1 Tax=Actinopolyspora xinjiangensis TaxID=405564 RepID=A0A1H0PYT0_9ACTN|nr:hypothetical protein [Actinopolyspora xinjiangensis]SDP10337.1 hypothetical protein SAMN04487905_1024 [Actinopolyspora xinjiangensis]